MSAIREDDQRAESLIRQDVPGHYAYISPSEFVHNDLESGF